MKLNWGMETTTLITSTKLSPTWEWKPLWLFYVTNVRASLHSRDTWMNVKHKCEWLMWFSESERFVIICIIYTNSAILQDHFMLSKLQSCIISLCGLCLYWHDSESDWLSFPDFLEVSVCTYSSCDNRHQFWAPQF